MKKLAISVAVMVGIALVSAAAQAGPKDFRRNDHDNQNQQKQFTGRNAFQDRDFDHRHISPYELALRRQALQREAYRKALLREAELRRLAQLRNRNRHDHDNHDFDVRLVLPNFSVFYGR